MASQVGGRGRLGWMRRKRQRRGHKHRRGGGHTWRPSLGILQGEEEEQNIKWGTIKVGMGGE